MLDLARLDRLKLVRRPFSQRLFGGALLGANYRWLPGIDLRFEDGRSGRIVCSLLSSSLLRTSLRVVGDAGELRVFNWTAPHLYHRLSVRAMAGRRVERVRGDASYTHQLRAFRDAVGKGAPFPTDARDAVANMRVIDAIYEASGLGRRGDPAFSSSRT